MIKQLGYDVIGEAFDGLEAIERFKELSPTYITIDLEMPNMNGIDASKEILSIDPNVKIVLITSIINKKELVSALKVGIKNILQKPITVDDLKRVINKIIDEN
jgi:two-component system chemotaxis response regulator CheY